MLIANLIFVFKNFEQKCPNLGILGQKSINFLILTKFWLYRISKVLILNLKFTFENFKPISKFGRFGPKSINLLILIKLFYIYFDGGDFSYYIRTKIRKCGNGTKPINASWGNFVKVLISSTKFIFNNKFKEVE